MIVRFSEQNALTGGVHTESHSLWIVNESSVSLISEMTFWILFRMRKNNVRNILFEFMN